MAAARLAGILQPAYLPWPGFFEQMQRAEVFIILDDVQFTKQDWRTRNRIRANTSNGFSYLSVPVRKAPVDTPISDILVAHEPNWVPRHLNLLNAHYANAPFFKQYFPEIKMVLESCPARLLDLDMALVEVLARALTIQTSVVYASDLKVPGHRTEKLINLCLAVGASDLYDGWSAQNFVDPEQFREAGLGLHYQRYQPVEYPQQYSPFIPFLSVVDLLFNCGSQSSHLVSLGGQVVSAVPSPAGWRPEEVEFASDGGS